MIIGTATYFANCECGEHGNIICTDGYQLVCYSRQSAREGAKTLKQAGKIVADEMPELLRQIEESDLPLYAEEESLLCIPSRDSNCIKLYWLDDPPWRGGRPISLERESIH